MNELFILKDIASNEQIFIGSWNECETLRKMIGEDSLERIKL